MKAALSGRPLLYHDHVGARFRLKSHEPPLSARL